jgi:cytosine/adenosine deaminase-related metal-dependent hydrolase
MAIPINGGTWVELAPPRLERRDAVLAGPEQGSIDATGCLVLPGLVLAHTHLYSGLARGMPGPASPPHTFQQILERVWWKLDVALDPASLAAAAEVALAEAALCGVTCLIDHHESPRFIEGSLDVIAEAAERVGLRAILCYGATDRHGHPDALRGLAEGLRFAARVAEQGHQRLGAMLGLHAAFTCRDETLAKVAPPMRAEGLGLHLHAAEDACDRDAITRLDHAGLLGPRTLLAHAVHASAVDLERVRATGATVVHNPRSNMQNAVGRARLAGLGDHVALGTDGMDADLFTELRAAHLTGRMEYGPDGGVDAVEMLATGARFAERILGPIDNDAVVLEYDPPTPLDAENLAGHLLFGLAARHVRDVVVDGRIVVRDRRLARVDGAQIAARGRVEAARSWARMSAGRPSESRTSTARSAKGRQRIAKP